MHCILVGNYGVGNVGDEALKDYFLSAFSDVEWSVVSASPKEGELHRLPGGVRSFLSFKWISTVFAIKQSDAVVFGSGTLFTDAESVHACILWLLYAWCARFFGVPYLLAFQGIGPFHTKLGEWCARNALFHASYISVRDRESHGRVSSWEAKVTIVETFDPVFQQMCKQRTDSKKSGIVFIPRHNSSPQKLLSLSHGAQINEQCSIVLMQPGHEEEQKVAHVLKAELGDNARIIPVADLARLMNSISSATHVYTERFHGALAALACSTPVSILPQKKGDKLDQLQALIQTGVDAEGLCALVDAGERSFREAIEQVTLAA